MHSWKQTPFELFDALPNGTKIVRSCNGYEFEELFWNPELEKAYYYNTNTYKELKLLVGKDDMNYCNFVDTTGHKRRVYFELTELEDIE